MAELLTESFCERCGTRYTFESAAPRRRLRGIKTLGAGLRTFVLSNDVSLDEAMAAARSDAEREASAHQLDAFHKTFSFCMNCRQYTCSDCWNGIEGRCLTCAPDPTRDALAHDALAASFDLQAVAPVEAVHDEVLSRIAPEPSVERPAEPAWPAEASWTAQVIEEAVTAVGADEAIAGSAIDLEASHEPAIEVAADLLARIGGQDVESESAIATELEATAETPDIPADTASEPTVETAAIVTEPAAEATTEAGPAAGSTDAAVHRATGRTSAFLAKFRPGQSLDAAIAEYEAGLEPADTAASPSTTSQPAPEPEPVMTVAEVAEVAEAAAAPVSPSAETPITAPGSPTPPVADSVPQPVWQAPEPRPADQATPQWPTGPRWPTSIPARGPAPQQATPVDPLTALLAREATDRLWAASNAELVSVPPPAAASATSVHECSNCGISLSATARFCRRCGTRQG